MLMLGLVLCMASAAAAQSGPYDAYGSGYPQPENDFVAPHDRFRRLPGDPRVGYEPGYGARPAQRLTAWMWAPHTRDSSTLDGRRIRRTVTFNDLIDDVVVPPVGARYAGTLGRWTFHGRFEYVETREALGPAVVGGLEADIRSSEMTLDGGARFRLFEWSWGAVHEQIDLGLWGEVGLGLRYWLLKERIDLSNGSDRKQSTPLFAFVASARAGMQITRELSVTFETDGGTAGGGNLTTRTAAMVQVRFDAHFALELGWHVQAFEFDVRRGRTVARHRQVSHGPVIAMTVHW